MVFCFLPGAPTVAVRIWAWEEEWVTNSSSEGPALSRSLNDVVGRLRGGGEDGVGSVGSETAVANDR